MRSYEVVLSSDAREHLLRLYEWIADAASPPIALKYLERIETYLNTFDQAPERGTRRDDIRPGLRVVGFERRLSIAFSVSDTRVTIQRIFYGGQDWASALGQEPG